MTDYHYMAERVFNEVRPAGSTFWLELSPGKRDYFADIVRAAERILPEPEPELDPWCPDCEEKDEVIEDLQDVVELRERKIEDLEERLAAS